LILFLRHLQEKKRKVAEKKRGRRKKKGLKEKGKNVSFTEPFRREKG